MIASHSALDKLDLHGRGLAFKTVCLSVFKYKSKAGSLSALGVNVDGLQKSWFE